MRLPLVVSAALLLAAGGILAISRGMAIAPLLPDAPGAGACFAGSFGGRTLRVHNRARSIREPTGRLSPEGDPMLRNRPGDLGSQAVHSLVLAISHDDRTASDGTLIHDFTLAAGVDVDGRPRRLLTRGDSSRDPAPVARLGEATLACGIDCDGGLLDVERVAFRSAVGLRFDARLALRMTLGCGGEGSFQVGVSDGDSGFTLEAAPTETCDAAHRKGAE